MNTFIDLNFMLILRIEFLKYKSLYDFKNSGFDFTSLFSVF